ncbi:hypothetical protein E3P99_03564 [Wallemia hederae]|uniref:Uncharacterized protein n=1 Tax=Wallemia hederae TaxID=1540922 RepID=A0A4T0FFZ0_9BASI|nr:hypothetical protein E3P99_03564 [Wallemia hederae]
MFLWWCCGRRNTKNLDEHSRLLEHENGGVSSNTAGNSNTPSTPQSRSPRDQLDSFDAADADDACLNDIVSKASDQMVNITNSTTSLKASTSIHSLKDLNSLSNWLQGDAIKLDKATDREQELIKHAALKLGEVFENAFDLSLSQSNSEASSRRPSVSSQVGSNNGKEDDSSGVVDSAIDANNHKDKDEDIDNERGVSIDQRRLSIDRQSMHEELENTPRQTISSTPR